MLDIDAVAERLGVAPHYVRAMIRRGDLKSVRLGPQMQRVPQAEVDRLLGEFA